MKTLTVEVPYETIDSIILASMNDVLDTIRLNKESRKRGEWSHPEDKKFDKKLKKAAKLIISYYDVLDTIRLK